MDNTIYHAIGAAPDTTAFLLSQQDEDILAQSDGFDILRKHLAESYDYNLCSVHNADRIEVSRWLIVRDVLHALLVPVVELFDKATALAISITAATRVEDLERAFSSQGRSAFRWLQCFLSTDRERDWCYTKGCPACVVQHSLHSEFSVRMLYAACLLSDVHYPFTLDGPQLPSFRFFLDNLQLALERDPLYGNAFFERMQVKAEATRNGIEELIHQCIELELDASRPSSPSESLWASSPAGSSTQFSPVLGPLGASVPSGRSETKVRRGRMARRQMSLQLEEEEWMTEMMRRCSEQLSVSADECFLSGPGQASESDLKLHTTVTVSEVPAFG